LPITRLHFDIVLLVLPEYSFSVDRQSISSSFDVGDLDQSIGDICPILPDTYCQLIYNNDDMEGKARGKRTYRNQRYPAYPPHSSIKQL
jgi:hypothetical protein